MFEKIFESLDYSTLEWDKNYNQFMQLFNLCGYGIEDVIKHGFEISYKTEYLIKLHP